MAFLFRAKRPLPGGQPERSPAPPKPPLLTFRRAAPGRPAPGRPPAPRPRPRGTTRSGSRPLRTYQVPTGVLAAVGGLLLLTLVVLLAYDDSPSAGARRNATGAQLYATYCATCHGAGGQGAVGSRLAGRVTQRFPNVDDEITLVSDGKAGMPSFATTLSPAQIRKIVEYTRTRLGG